MTDWQRVLLLLFGCLNVFTFIKGWHESVTKKNPYGKATFLGWLGMFVWGDAVIMGLFLSLATFITLWRQDWWLFWLIFSAYWLVRSVGETIYWLNEQFSTTKHNPPETLTGHRFFKDDSIWFIYQIYWQCVSVISLIATIYFAHMWLKN
jgi:hypothetical protein